MVKTIIVMPWKSTIDQLVFVSYYLTQGLVCADYFTKSHQLSDIHKIHEMGLKWVVKLEHVMTKCLI